MSENVFKSLDEQLQILKDRELTIINEEKAKLFLLNNNYYRISGYSLTLRNHDVFYNSACFQNIIDIYNFDYELRHILLKYIEVVEVRIKSIWSCQIMCSRFTPKNIFKSVKLINFDFLPAVCKPPEAAPFC